MARFGMGQPVATTYAGDRCVGEVVGIQAAGEWVLYDVSLADVVVKAVPEQELAAVGAVELQALVRMGMEGGATATDIREGVLRERHLRFLTSALARMVEGEATDAQIASVGFEPGAQVALRSGNAWQLGVVRGLVRTSEGVGYDLEAMDELVRASERDLAPLSAADVGGAFCLGDRVRLVASGHEADDDFAGVVCMVEPGPDGVSFGIAFDDGDVFVGLDERDLVAAGA